MELKMNPVTLPKPLTFNYDELKSALEEKVAMYEKAIYAPEQMAAAKADRAALNRLKKALNDERLSQERAYMAPFNQFKTQVNELIRIIDAPVAAIDKQIKSYEERKREEKRDQIEAYFTGCAFPEGITLEKVFEQQWLNASVTMRVIQNEIDARRKQIDTDLAVIRSLPEYAFEAEQTYISTLDLAKAVSEAHRRSDEAKKKAEWEARVQQFKAERDAMLQPTGKAKETEAPEQPAQQVKTEVAMREWVSFRVLITLDDAKALREFCQQRGISIEAL